MLAPRSVIEVQRVVLLEVGLRRQDRPPSNSRPSHFIMYVGNWYVLIILILNLRNQFHLL